MKKPTVEPWDENAIRPTGQPPIVEPDRVHTDIVRMHAEVRSLDALICEHGFADAQRVIEFKALIESIIERCERVLKTYDQGPD